MNNPKKTDVMNQNEIVPEEWPVKPYYKRDLAVAYAPDITPVAALNRLAAWIRHNQKLWQALLNTGYMNRQRIFTSVQAELIFLYLGRP
jgi:hypothetical protein